METAVTEKKLNDSLSKKEVTFSNEFSILHYSTDSTVDSLNSSMTKNSRMSHKIPDCQVNLTSDYCSSDLKKVIVVLKRLPEKLVKKYSNLNGVSPDVSCCLKNVETQNINQACSSNSDPFQTVKINKVPEEQRFLHNLLNVKVLIHRLPDNFIKHYEMCSAADTSLENTYNEPSELCKNVNPKTQATEVSRKNHKTKQSLLTNQNLDSVQSLENSLERTPLSAELLTSECQDNTCLENTNKEVINLNRAVNCVKKKSSEISSKEQNEEHLNTLFTDEEMDILNYLISLENSFEEVPAFEDLITSEYQDNMCSGNTSNEVANLNKIVNHVRKKPSKKHNKKPKKFVTSDSRNNECLKNNCMCKFSKEVNHANAYSSKFLRKKRKKIRPVFPDKNTDFVQYSVSLLNSSENNEYPSTTNSTPKNKVIKSLNSGAHVPSNDTASQNSEVSFEEYPCTEDISYTFDQFQNKKVVSLNLEPQIVTNTADFCNANENALLNETNKSEIATPSKSVLNNENTINPNLFGDLSSNNSSEARFISNMPPNEKVDPEVLYALVPVINTEKTNISRRDTLLNNASEIASDVNSVLLNHKNSSEGELSVCNEDIINHTKSKNSDLYIDANKRFPYILLEKINFSALQGVIKDHTYSLKENTRESTEMDLTSPINDDTNTTDLPIKIKKVCSISKRKFNKTRKHNKKLTNEVSSHADNFKKCETSVINPQIYDNSLLQTSESNSKISTSSENSSSEDDRPLINTMKHKYALVHSADYSTNGQQDSSSEDISSSENSSNRIPPIYLVKNSSYQIVTNKANKKSLHDKSQKHRKGASSHCSSKSPSRTLLKMCSQTSSSVLNKKKVIENNKHIQTVKNKIINKSAKPSKTKTDKKSFKKKQKKIYQLLTKYLKMQMKSMSKKEKTTKSMKQKKSRKNQKNLRDSKSEESVTSTEESCFESDSSTALVYNSNEEENQRVQNKYSFQGKVKTSQSKKMSKNESTVKKSANAKASKKIFDKYRLGFLSRESYIRLYNRVLASERLLLSKGKKKKEKKKQFKKLLKIVKEVGSE